MQRQQHLTKLLTELVALNEDLGHIIASP